jgi:hypothetical protein
MIERGRATASVTGVTDVTGSPYYRDARARAWWGYGTSVTSVTSVTGGTRPEWLETAKRPRRAAVRPVYGNEVAPWIANVLRDVGALYATEFAP